MRCSSACLASFGAFVLALASCAARADTITFAPTNGDPAVTYTFDPSNPAASAVGSYSEYLSAAFNQGGSDVVSSGGTIDNVILFLGSNSQASPGSPSPYLLVESNDPATSGFAEAYYFGPLVFSGDVSLPTLLPGVYTLTDSYSNTTSIVTVDGGFAPTPEPSSLMLLGTGVMGMGGMRRRRALERRLPTLRSGDSHALFGR